MFPILLLDDIDVKSAFATYLQCLRKQAKLSRESLAQKSGVPSATIKKFEQTGNISLRQFLLLWQSLDNLERLFSLTQTSQNIRTRLPTTIEEVLEDEF